MKSSLGNILLSLEDCIPITRMHTSELLFKMHYLSLSFRILTLMLQAPDARVGEVRAWEGMEILSFIKF